MTRSMLTSGWVLSGPVDYRMILLFDCDVALATLQLQDHHLAVPFVERDHEGRRLELARPRGVGLRRLGAVFG